jgi:hypothetical protein
MLAQVGEGDRFSPAERMAAANPKHEWFDRDYSCPHSWRERVGTHANDGCIDVAGSDGAQQRLIVLIGERDLDRGMRTVKIAERLGETVIDGSRDADPQPPVQHPAQGGDRVAASLGRRERHPRVRQQCLARGSQRDTGSIAMKQRLSELALQATDLGAHRRLRDRHPVSRTRELPLLGHCHEVRELAQVHIEVFCSR